MKNRTKIFLVLTLSGFLIYLVFRAPLPFIESQWEKRGGNTKPFNIPHRMADNLVSSDRLIGRTPEDIISLLGEPSASGYFREYDFVYNLGAERGLFVIDNEWLVLKIDEAGKVSTAKVVSD